MSTTAGGDDTLLANRLVEARTVLGLTQTDVSEALSLNRTSISDIETGNRKVTGLELRRLARLYRRPVGWFLGEQTPPVPDGIIAAVAGLSEKDRDAVLAFARFLAHQTVTR